MPSPLSSSRALSRLILGRGLRNDASLLWRNRESERELGRFAQSRFLGSLVGFGGPCVGDLVNSRKMGEFSVGELSRISDVRKRWFLGVGDGEEGDAVSKTHEERRVMGYSPEQLFAVVAAVDLYEEFLPWCTRSRVIRRNSDGSFDAELEIGFKFLVESYVSHVQLEKPKYIKTTSSESGLFDHLINIWEFNPGPVPGSCDLHFFVDFKFQSPLYSQVVSLFFREVVSKLVSSFSDRCRRIYGPGVQILENPHGQGT